jgi:signal peptidase I
MIRKTLVAAGLVLFALVTAVLVMSNRSYVTTPSMYPTIPPGSEIFVSHEAHYRVGQVIEFRDNGLIWAHRLIKIKPNGDFITKGDNPQNTPDVFIPALTQANVIGAVTHAPRWVGFPELIVHHPGYGLAWLRAELGLSGKIGLVALVGLLSLLSASGGRRAMSAASGRRVRFSARPEDILKDPLSRSSGRRGGSAGSEPAVAPSS